MKSKHKNSQENEEEGVAPKKKVRTAPTNTSLLPPCKVCQEPAAGFHYGVNTCEACKGFFRRSLLRKEGYKCLGTGDCNIQAGKRKICPRCRHEKCLVVGMSKGAIKTGRYTHAKRTQDILEYKQMIGSPIDNLPTTLSSVASFASPASESQDSESSSQSSVNASVVSQNMSRPFSSVNSSTQVQPLSSSIPLVSGTFNPHSPFSQFSQQFELSSTLPFSLITENMLDSLVDGQGRMDEVTSPWSNVSSSPLSAVSSSTSPSKTVPAATVCTAKDDIDESECERIAQQLVGAHDQLSLSFQLSPEEMLVKQKACAEACKLRTEMFGPLKRLSEEEYQDIYQQTGLDVDGRQPFLTMLSNMLDDNIRRYTAYVKNIPGFSQLSLKDQIRLIKDNRLEFAMLSQYHGYNHELQVMTMSSGRTICIHDFDRFADRVFSLQRFEVAKTLKKLGLSHEEEIILKSLFVVTIGNEDVDEPEKVSAVQWKLAKCLLWLLKRNRPDPNCTFARIMSAFCQVRCLSSRMYDWIKTKPFEHYSQFKDNALLAEWFSNS